MPKPEWKKYYVRDIDDTEVYIGDIGIFSNSWDSHIAKLDRILDKFEENNFIINPRKYKWAPIKETDWLGYWLSPEGIKPWTKKGRRYFESESPLKCHLTVIPPRRHIWRHLVKLLSNFVTATDEVGRPSGTVRVLSLARIGFEMV